MFSAKKQNLLKNKCVIQDTWTELVVLLASTKQYRKLQEEHIKNKKGMRLAEKLAGHLPYTHGGSYGKSPANGISVAEVLGMSWRVKKMWVFTALKMCTFAPANKTCAITTQQIYTNLVKKQLHNKKNCAYNLLVVVVVNIQKPFTHASPRTGEPLRGSCKRLFYSGYSLPPHSNRQGALAYTADISGTQI